jgi:hypothetical protein
MLEILFDPFHRRLSFTGRQRCISFLMGYRLHIRGSGGGQCFHVYVFISPKPLPHPTPNPSVFQLNVFTVNCNKKER